MTRKFHYELEYNTRVKQVSPTLQIYFEDILMLYVY